MRIVQFQEHDGRRKVAKVAGEQLITISRAASTYELVHLALAEGKRLPDLIESGLVAETTDYAEVVRENRLLPPIDHPDPARFIISGTGLTHLGSASARDAMHRASATDEATKTDSMKMFELGLKGGRPTAGEIGVQPEWFYKGDGATVRAPGHPIYSPDFALLDGDEIEVCAFHVIAADGTPVRIGHALGNEFADHRTEKMNYLYLAHSKLRECSFGPELLIGELPEEVRGASRILREGKVLWRKEFLSGEKYMSHTLANLEYHHFKYDMFRRPGDLHAHFLGTATVSFADGIEPQPGDIFEMQADCFGQPLRNTLAKKPEAKFEIKSIY